MDYLHRNTTISLGYTSSAESDFDATTYNFSVSQDMFGDLTTLTLSYALGDDVVGRSDDETFSRNNTRQHYGIGLTQILTRNLITTLNVETITDEGYLNNPYCSVRSADPDSSLGYSFEPELYSSAKSRVLARRRRRADVLFLLVLGCRSPHCGRYSSAGRYAVDRPQCGLLQRS